MQSDTPEARRPSIPAPPEPTPPELVGRETLIGALWGTALGDAIALPYEGLSRSRVQRWGIGAGHGVAGHRLVGGRGMVSDDTEHTCMVASAWLQSDGDSQRFQQILSWKLRGWLLLLPAGVGLATLKAIARLWLGISPDRSGVFSAGNGPAMRSGILGVLVALQSSNEDWPDQIRRLRPLIRASTRLTHTDPKAEYGALAVAIAAGLAAQAQLTGDRFLTTLGQALAGEPAAELLQLLEQAVISAYQGEATPDFAAAQGWTRGVSGYVYQTVPAAIHACLRWTADPTLEPKTQFKAAIQGLIACGGDTDSTAAIAGGILGAQLGRQGLPADWLDGLWDWPRSLTWMEQLAGAIATHNPNAIPKLPLWGLGLRNLAFLSIVLAHGFRRLLP